MEELSLRLAQLNEKHFGFSKLPPIRWSKGRLKKKYRKITFGTYDFRKNEIRIHPILKNAAFPGFVLDFVIFHELLHFENREELSGQSRFRRKKRIHDTDFHSREEKFPFRKEAIALMRKIACGIVE
jgi:predicted SprT family Zn-dependent metalloprotease